jgi:two-component sensor histidine kinase
LVRHLIDQPSRKDRILASEKEIRLDVENADLRRLLAQAGIDAAEHKVLESLQRLLLEELHHRIKNVLATVMAITSQTLRNTDNVKDGRVAIEHRLLALGRVHDLLLRTQWTSATLASIIETAIEPFDKGARFSVQTQDIEVSPAARDDPQRTLHQCRQVWRAVEHRRQRGDIGGH